MNEILLLKNFAMVIKFDKEIRKKKITTCNFFFPSYLSFFKFLIALLTIPSKNCHFHEIHLEKKFMMNK